MPGALAIESRATTTCQKVTLLSNLLCVPPGSKDPTIAPKTYFFSIFITATVVTALLLLLLLLLQLLLSFLLYYYCYYYCYHNIAIASGVTTTTTYANIVTLTNAMITSVTSAITITTILVQFWHH